VNQIRGQTIDYLCSPAFPFLSCQDIVPDLPVKEAMTNSLDAFRSYVNGIYYFELNYPSIYLGINKAINLDSTFAIASYWLASEIIGIKQVKKVPPGI